MVQLYVRRIQDPTIEFTIDDVPERWREDVINALENNAQE